MTDFDAKAREIIDASKYVTAAEDGGIMEFSDADLHGGIAAALKAAYNQGLDDGYSAGTSGLVGRNFHHHLAIKALASKKVPT